MVTSTYNKFNIAVEAFANGLIRASTVGDTFIFLLTNTLPTADLKTSTQLSLIPTSTPSARRSTCRRWCWRSRSAMRSTSAASTS